MHHGVRASSAVGRAQRISGLSPRRPAGALGFRVKIRVSVTCCIQVASWQLNGKSLPNSWSTKLCCVWCGAVYAVRDGDYGNIAHMEKFSMCTYLFLDNTII